MNPLSTGNQMYQRPRSGRNIDATRNHHLGCNRLCSRHAAQSLRRAAPGSRWMRVNPLALVPFVNDANI